MNPNPKRALKELRSIAAEWQQSHSGVVIAVEQIEARCFAVQFSLIKGQSKYTSQLIWDDTANLVTEDAIMDHYDAGAKVVLAMWKEEPNGSGLNMPAECDQFIQVLMRAIGEGPPGTQIEYDWTGDSPDLASGVSPNQLVVQVSWFNRNDEPFPHDKLLVFTLDEISEIKSSKPMMIALAAVVTDTVISIRERQQPTN